MNSGNSLLKMKDEGTQCDVVSDELSHLDNKHYMEGFPRYDASYAQYLMAKYEKPVILEANMSNAMKNKIEDPTTNRSLLHYKPEVSVVVDEEINTAQKKRKRD